MSGRIEYYTDAAGEHRWRVVHSNGNVLADSAEGYVNLADAISGAQSTANILADHFAPTR